MKTARRFWTFGISTPLIYLIICIIFNRTVFYNRPTPGFWPMSETAFGWVFAIAATLVTISLPLLYLLKTRWAMRCADAREEAEDSNDGQNEDTALFSKNCTFRFLVLFMISDTAGFIGLILFLLQGRLSTMLFFGIVSFLDYAISYPGEKSS